MDRGGPMADQLLGLVEGQYREEATPLYVVPVRHLAGELFWHGNVHVFRLSQRRVEGFAWSCQFDGALHAIIKSDLIPGPSEAVRSALHARGWVRAETANRSAGEQQLPSG